MHWFTGVLLFTIIWWTVLFAVLPFGTRPVEDADPAAGGWRGAPEKPLLGRKLVWTTAISTVLFALCVVVIEGGWLGFREGLFAPRPTP